MASSIVEFQAQVYKLDVFEMQALKNLELQQQILQALSQKSNLKQKQEQFCNSSKKIFYLVQIESNFYQLIPSRKKFFLENIHFDANINLILYPQICNSTISSLHIPLCKKTILLFLFKSELNEKNFTERDTFFPHTSPFHIPHTQVGCFEQVIALPTVFFPNGIFST